MSDSEMSDDLEKRIAELSERANSLGEEGLYRSEASVNRELRRLAKSEGQLLPYLNSCFHLMNHASSRFEPEGQAEVAIELIALLENEDHARQIQSDLPEERYASAKAWMTACAYDNLAVATGTMNGYNSDGMHACVNEGIQVCRRTGKLQCITCFREYATQIHMAADDLDLAQHFARMGEAQQDPGPHDRRWVGVFDLAEIHLLRGELDEALAAALRAWRATSGYHSPRSARRETRAILTTILLMMGRESELDAMLAEAGVEDEPESLPPGENPEAEYTQAKVDALRLCIEGNPEAALAILTRFEKTLEQRKYLHEWFEVKLRIIAALLLADRADDAKAQAKVLESRASIARDWFTQRRLSRLLDPEIQTTPLALVGDVKVGPYAVDSKESMPITGAPESRTEPGDDDDSETELGEATPLQEHANSLFMRLRSAESEEFPAVSIAVLNEILELDPSQIRRPEEAGPFLYLVRMLASEEADLSALWTWAKELAVLHPNEAGILNQLAAFGNRLITEQNVPAEGDLEPDHLAAMFRKSLDLAPEDGGNFARAGSFYLAMEDAGEAERCLARAFRLDRSSGYVAKKLADLYTNSGRSRDALAVLDLCLREGSDDPEVSWDAVMLSNNLGQWESCLSYADHFEKHRPEQPWVHYFRASALLELNRGPEALEAAQEEAKRSPEAPFSSMVLSACALSAMGEVDAYRERLAAILEQRLGEVTYLTQRGLIRLHELLWKSAQVLDRNDPLRSQLETHMLATGLAPNDLFTEIRATGEKVEGVNFYQVMVEQPLDAKWAGSHACLASETEWTSYQTCWGILAKDEEQASEIAQQWQARCYPIAAKVVSVEMTDDGFRDAIGVVWQGMRDAPADPSDDETESEE